MMRRFATLVAWQGLSGVISTWEMAGDCFDLISVDFLQMLIHEVDSQSTNFSCFLLKKLNWFPYHLEFDFCTQSLSLQQGDTCMVSTLEA